MLGNPAKARAIFERWMEWEPEDNAWSAYVKFEMRQEEPGKARWGPLKLGHFALLAEGRGWKGGQEEEKVGGRTGDCRNWGVVKRASRRK